MRLSMLMPGLLVFTLLNGSSAVRAEEAQAEQRRVLTPELVEAHYALQLARQRANDYQFVTLTATRRALDDEQQLVEAEVRILQGRLRDYRRFLRVGEYSPVHTAAESHYLALRGAEGRLRQIQDERIALMRSTRGQHTLNDLEILYAATRLAQVKQELDAERQ